MKVILLQPPIEDFYETKIRLMPLGLAYLKASLLKIFSGMECKILDFHSGYGRNVIPLPEELKYLRDYYIKDESPFSTFSDYFHFGASYDFIGRVIKEENPDLVCISSLFTPYYREVIKTAEVIKKAFGDTSRVPVVVGGHHASIAPETLLKTGFVDFVIRGEGEKPLNELVSALKKNEFLISEMKLDELKSLPNLSFIRDEKLYANDRKENYDINDLPIPDFSDLEPGRYKLQGRPLTFILSSRGCPRNCSFCTVHSVFPSYKKRSNETVLAEMKVRYEAGYRAFDFEDDNLTCNKKEALSLLKAISETFKGGDVSLHAMNGIEFASLDKELLVAMREAFFYDLNLSLVSINGERNLEKYLSVVKEASELKFNIVAYNIIGLPSETVDQMVETIKFNARLPVLMGPSMYYIVPEARINETCGIRLEEKDFVKSRLTAMAYESDKFSREDLYTLFVSSRIINFIKSFDVENTNELLALQFNERKGLGIEVLKRLLSEGRLYAFQSGKFIENIKFKVALFEKIWFSLEYIVSRNGRRINVVPNENS